VEGNRTGAGSCIRYGTYFGSCERVSASTGALISVEYRSAPFGQGRQPNYVTISRDPSGRYLLLTYGGPAGFFTGWIDHSKLRFLPIAQPHPGYPISA
jgi:hypothetical protein